MEDTNNIEGITKFYKSEVDVNVSNSNNTLGAKSKDTNSYTTALYIPNELIYAITPTSTGYVVTFVNYGLDAIERADFVLTIYKNSGAFVATKDVHLTNLKVGTTTYTWTISKSATVQERVTMVGTAYDGETFILDGDTVRYNFAGGKYGTMSAYDGQRHHMPSSNALTSSGILSTYSGPCIRMITTDHYLTASYGSSPSAVAFRNSETRLLREGKFLAAQNLGINDIQSIFYTKYNAAINDMIFYTIGLGYTE